MAILCGYQAGRIALFGWLYARARNSGWPQHLVFLGAFAASEQAFPLLFTWYYGATVHNAPVLAQTAELGGPILVAMVLVAANLALAELIIARMLKRAARPKLIAALLAPTLVALIYGVIRIPQVERLAAEAPKARVGLVQANMSLLGKRRDRNEGLRRHMNLTRKLQAEGKHDLIVWSETSAMSPVEETEAAPQLLRRFTAQLHTPTLFGGVLVRPVNDAREYVLFNSALLTDTSGKLVGRYDKQFLLAFGEYIPFGDTFPVLYEWSPHSGRFTPGKSFEPLPLGDRQIATFICYEDISPSFVNRIVRRRSPALLVNLTNDAWFGDTTEPWIHLALAKFRAIEHRRYFVRSTNSGVSAFIDPVGRVMSNTQPFVEETLSAEVAWIETKTLYELWGDAPWWLVSLGMLVACFKRRTSADTAAFPKPTVGPSPTPATTLEKASNRASFAAKAHAWFKQHRTARTKE
jgi:apolipoprotein N-acyltransferase